MMCGQAQFQSLPWMGDHLCLGTSCAQAESESISKNMKWGIRARMENGTYTAPSVPFGYRWGSNGLVIHQEEADCVKWIFAEYLPGRNTEDIAKELRIRSMTNPVLAVRKWSYQTIVNMLKNEKYLVTIFGGIPAF